jgi:phage antirepressor YoqD-like protein
MNIAVFGNEPTMTSREIADLVESRHDKVKQSIERLAERGLVSPPPVGEYLDPLGRPAKEYRLTKRDSYVVVAQLSPEFTARLVDRWQELEQGAAVKVPQSFAEALQLAADQAKCIEQQAKQIEAAQPALQFVGRYVESSRGAKGFREVCKVLKAKEPEFRDFLQDRKIMYRLGGAWTAYQNHIDAGRFEVKTGTANDHAYSQAKFTPKGIEWVAGEWAKHQLRSAA